MTDWTHVNNVINNIENKRLFSKINKAIAEIALRNKTDLFSEPYMEILLTISDIMEIDT